MRGLVWGDVPPLGLLTLCSESFCQDDRPDLKAAGSSSRHQKASWLELPSLTRGRTEFGDIGTVRRNTADSGERAPLWPCT